MDAFLSYATLVLAALATVGTLIKDAENYKRVGGRFIFYPVCACAILLFIGGIVRTHATRKQAAADKIQAAKDRDQLVDIERKSQLAQAMNQTRLDDANKSLQQLQDKVAQLMTQAQTRQLTQQLSDVKKELDDAQTKLRKPLAHFVATFATPYYDAIPITETAGERTANGIKVHFGVENKSLVPANNGTIVLRLCGGCSFGEEPEGFIKTSGGPSDERVRSFAHMDENTVIQDMSATIVPPLDAADAGLMDFGVMVKCETCEPGVFNILKIRVPRVLPFDFSKNKKSSKPTKH